MGTVYAGTEWAYFRFFCWLTDFSMRQYSIRVTDRTRFRSHLPWELATPAH